MKHLKRFIIFAIVMGIGGLLLLKMPATQFQGKDSQALTQHYNTIKAEDINSKEILIYIDGEPLKSERDGRIWMSDQLALMVPDRLVNDLFQCTVAWTEKDTVVVMKDDVSCEVQIDEPNSDAALAAIDADGQISLSATFLADKLGYAYQWDEENNAAYFTSAQTAADSLPRQYDLRELGRVSDVRDQGSWGTCWAFASLSALESSLLPDQKWQFSVEHLVMENGFNTDVDDGGDFNMTLAYLTSWEGPIAEGDAVYGTGLKADEQDAVVHLQEAVIINERDYDQIKSLIMQYGAVQSAIYSLPDIQELSDYYSEENAAYYYPESRDCNHDIVIIGWDDDYPKENFATMPEEDGAFICKNSWGSDFGKDGYFYISYEDQNIGIYGVAYTRVDAADNYDSIYQSDRLGWTGSIGYDEPSAWFSSVYEAEEDSLMRAIGFYATDISTYYDVYLIHNFDSVEDFERREIIQSGYLNDKGYYTIDLSQQLQIAQGEKFAVVVRIYTENSSHPIAMEYASGTLTEEVDISDGESYMSYNGNMWSHMETASGCNACLKVYMDDAD